jgi:hypothetical protein
MSEDRQSDHFAEHLHTSWLPKKQPVGLQACISPDGMEERTGNGELL